MITYNKKSIHARLYKFTYDDKLPNDLCPYFWKFVFALVVFIPNFIIQLPAKILYFFMKKYKKDFTSRYTPGGGRSVGLLCYVGIFIIYMYLYGLIEWIKMIFNTYSYSTPAAHFTMIITGLTAVIFLTILFAKYIKKKVDGFDCDKQKKSNIIKDFIKSKKEKYCPKIEWLD
jgi:hypothetical protein